MIELPEARTISRDLRKEILGKEIVDVKGNFADHKFTFYYNNPEEYKHFLLGKKITNIIDRNFYVEIEAEDYVITFRDGANIRLFGKEENRPQKSKLLLEFQDGAFINVTVSMYAFIAVFEKNKGMDNEYYNIELNGIGALDERFTYEYFKSLIDDNTKKLSVKAFLATEQRILGIGNGVVQDIMYNAKLHPKRKINTLSEKDVKILYDSVLNTLIRMVEYGGRDTEKNIYGENGNYKTILSSKSYKNGCPICKGEIKKENYLGGSIYYCPNCQM